MWSVICFNLDQFKILSSGNGLKFSPKIGSLQPIVGTCTWCSFFKVLFKLNSIKALVDEKINVTHTLKFVFGEVENTLGNRRKCWYACYQHFLLFPKCLLKTPCSGLLKVRIAGKELKRNICNVM